MKALFAVSGLVVLLSGFAWFELASDDEASSRAPASAPQNYDSLSGCDKQEVLWDRIRQSVHKDLPPYSKFGVSQLVAMNFQEISKKGSRSSDFAPEGWRKYLHRRGVVAKVKFVPKASAYTGVFQGADCGLLRLSLTYKTAGKRPVAPGLALKILRDGQPSANISALVSLHGQEKDFNFFKHPMSNIVPMGKDLGQKLVHKVFRKVSRYPEELLLEDLASIDAHGKASRQVIAPRQLFFVPASDFKFSSEEHDVREDLLTLSEGTTVYKVMALTSKFKDHDYSTYKEEDVAGLVANSEHIGDIVTTSEFTASAFGDEGIFFRHQLRP